MTKWWTRQFVHQRWSNLWYFGLLAVFLTLQAFGPGPWVAVLMCCLLFIVCAPGKLNLGDKIVAWERKRYPL